MLEKTDQFADGPFESAESPIAPRTSWPSRIVKKILGLGWLFIAAVLVPTLVAVLYFGLLSSDVYVSESRFVVRSPEKPAASGFGVLLKTAGFANSGDEIFAAQDYVTSRDALNALNKDDAFRRSYGSQQVAYLNRFGTLITGDTSEDLFEYYTSRIKLAHDSSSSITALTVRAFNPQDAQRFNEQLLEMAEATVNRLNERGRQDLIRFASREVEEAKEGARTAALALSAYRNREGVVDPERQAAVQLQMISKLQDEMIAARTQLVSLRSITPQNSQIGVLQTRIRELGREIDEELGKVAGSRNSLSSSAAQYQRLVLESQFADKQLAAAMTSLQEAQNEARRKQAYVERIVQPNLPDEALEPRRWRGILATLVLGLVAWGVLSMLLAGVKAHRD